MLARLKMTVDDSISEFQVLCEAIFAHPRIGTIGGVLREKYDHHKLEQIIRKLVEKRQRFYDDSLQTTRFQSDEAECRT